MGKKKKLKKLAESNMKILANGKLKVSRGQKIKLDPFIKNSVDEAVISRIDGILTKEDVLVDESDLKVEINTNLTSDLHVAELSTRMNKVGKSTIALVIPKKDALDIFNWLADDTIGELLRTSTLASIYGKLKPQWTELNKGDNTSFTNVMYIPGVMVFIDSMTGKFKKSPMSINLLIIAVPPTGKMDEEGIEKISDEDAAARVIADIIESGIKCGVKDLIVNPYGYKVLNKDERMTAVLWNQITTGQRVIEQYNSITFSIEDDDKFVIFNAARSKK